MLTKEFRADIAAVLNKHSIENMSNTPDWILADCVAQFLHSFAYGVNSRESWYGREIEVHEPK